MSIEEVGVGASAATTVWATILIGRDIRQQFLIDMVGLLGLV